MKRKWNLEFHVPRSSELPKEAIPKPVMRSLQKELQVDEELLVDELEKTVEEKQIIQGLSVSVRKILRNLQMKELSIPERHIHILSDEDFDKLKTAGTTKAFYRGGHIYVKRKPHSQMDMVSDLSHEIAHKISYLSKELRIRNYEEEPIIDVFNNKQLGFGIHKAYTDKTIGRGFNEAMTEIFSQAIRTVYSEYRDIPSDAESEFTDYPHAYHANILVVEKLYPILNEEHPDEACVDMLKSFINGDKQIFQKITSAFRKRGVPDAVKILLEMEPNEQSAIETAKKLNLDTFHKTTEI